MIQRRRLVLIALVVTGIAISMEGFAEPDTNPPMDLITFEHYLAQFFPGSSSPFKRMRYTRRSPQKSKSDNRDFDYKNLVLDLDNLREFANLKAFQHIPNFNVLVNWHLGEKIVAYREKIRKPVENENHFLTRLAKDLAFEKNTLVDRVLFYRAYTEITSVSTDLSWDHYAVLIQIPDDARRTDFQARATANGWSRDELEKQIRISP